jgi:hypothetical protein
MITIGQPYFCARRMCRRTELIACSRESSDKLPSFMPDIGPERGSRQPATIERTLMPVSRRESSKPLSRTGASDSPSSSRRKPIATAAKAWSSMVLSRVP